MAAYLIVNYQVDDPDGYRRYRAAGAGELLGVGTTSELVVRDRESVVLEGDPGHQTVMIRFASKEEALEKYRSAEYQEVLGLRLGASSRHFAVVVDAVDV